MCVVDLTGGKKWSRELKKAKTVSLMDIYKDRKLRSGNPEEGERRVKVQTILGEFAEF